MSLYACTRDLHHACERHPFGARLSRGEISPQEYADWLASLQALHMAIDQLCPAHMHRFPGFSADAVQLLQHFAVVGRPSIASRSPCLGYGAAYVLHGAHRTGGQIMRATMTAKGFPTWHLYYPDHRGAKRFVDDLRDRSDVTAGARATFDTLLATMDEVQIQV